MKSFIEWSNISCANSAFRFLQMVLRGFLRGSCGNEVLTALLFSSICRKYVCDFISLSTKWEGRWVMFIRNFVNIRCVLKHRSFFTKVRTLSGVDQQKLYSWIYIMSCLFLLIIIIRLYNLLTELVALIRLKIPHSLIFLFWAM